ncbi:MAG: AAA family ATPase [Clostridia bacterium]|nr:AAA family ATPase [Clostridia bacterium]
MKKLPYGISNYEELITQNYYYVDKTKYIEQLENIAEKSIIFLRPRKFGKTLFTSTIQYYYDKNEKNKFEKLFGETYIGKNPTQLKNSYHILRFNFAGIDTSNEENTIKGFKSKIIASIEWFIARYRIDFYINKDDEAENILNNLFIAFGTQKNGEKIYVIIDEYDRFANELLGFQTENFKKLVSKNEKVRKWYEVLKEGTESVVDRIFVTGVAPITLDSMTSGFNIGTDKTKDGIFNEMLGFTKVELENMMSNIEISKEEQEKIFPVMKENYDGYLFSLDATTKIYNSTMCLYFLNQYLEYNKAPRSLVDVNIASDFSKLSNMLNLCKGENKKQVLENTLTDKGIMTEITSKFNPENEFGIKEMVSMLYYIGYLTIKEERIGMPVLKIPNMTMKEIYAEYFLKTIKDETNIEVDFNESNKILEEIALEGKIDTLIEVTHRYLNNLSNRDYQRFEEKYVKLVIYCLAMNLKTYSVISEQENNRTYQDLLLIPRDISKGYQSVLMELKYLKVDEKDKLKEKQQEAKEQIKRYSELENIKNIENLHKYAVVAVNDELYVEEIN